MRIYPFFGAERSAVDPRHYFPRRFGQYITAKAPPRPKVESPHRRGRPGGAGFIYSCSRRPAAAGARGPWGTPLLSTGPAWKKDASNTAEEQSQQVGMHHDGMHFFLLARGPEGSRRGLLVLNHEYVGQAVLYPAPDGATPMTAEKVAKALAAHGVTVIEIQLVDGAWRPVGSHLNRRVAGTTPMAFSGPVSAGHPLLQSNNAPMGTLNSCAHGFTLLRSAEDIEHRGGEMMIRQI